MGWLPWVAAVLVVACAGWFGVGVIRLLRQIAGELGHIRKHLQDVSGELGKVSGPLDYVQKIYGVGEGLLRRKREK